MPRGAKPYAVLVHHELLPDFIAPGCVGCVLICELKWGSQTLMARRFHQEWKPGKPEGRDVYYRGQLYKWVEKPSDASTLLRAEFHSFVLDLERLLAKSN